MEKSQWKTKELIEILSQCPDSIVNLVLIIEGENRVVGTTEFLIQQDGRNIILLGTSKSQSGKYDPPT